MVWRPVFCRPELAQADFIRAINNNGTLKIMAFETVFRRDQSVTGTLIAVILIYGLLPKMASNLVIDFKKMVNEPSLFGTTT